MGPKVFESCPESRCTIEKDVRKAQAVMISHKFLLPFDWQHIREFRLPQKYWNDQKWVFFSDEPPAYRPVAEKYLHRFNITFTYRRDSDVYYPYGEMVDKTEEEMMMKNVTSTTTNVTTEATTLNVNTTNDAERKAQFLRKRKNILWVASNCQTNSARENYIRQLKKHIDVAIFGGCGRKTCPRNMHNVKDSPCIHEKQDDYRFYLAFENSLCKDYATEKLFRTLTYDMIPIVYGIANYSEILPHKSYINIADFKSPLHLAKHLKEISKNWELFKEYMAWKETKAVRIDPFRRATCDLCEYLHRTKSEKRRMVDLSEFWGAETNCITPDTILPSLGVKYIAVNQTMEGVKSTKEGVNSTKEGVNSTKEGINSTKEGVVSTKEGGMGLGLPIAKQIIEMHDGSLSLLTESEQTTFEIMLPLAKEEQEEVVV